MLGFLTKMYAVISSPTWCHIWEVTESQECIHDKNSHWLLKLKIQHWRPVVECLIKIKRNKESFHGFGGLTSGMGSVGQS